MLNLPAHTFGRLSLLSLIIAIASIARVEFAAAGGTIVRLDPPEKLFLSGQLADNAWLETVPGVVWNGTPLREAATQFGMSHRLSVLIDRRVDPGTPVELTVGTATAEDVFEQLAAEADATIVRIDGLVVIASAEHADTLTPLILLAMEGIADNAHLRRVETVRWGDLTEPRQIVNDIAAAYDLRVENQEAIPHDLLSRGVLPDLNLAQSLSAVLWQYGLTFDLGESGRTVKIGPVPVRIVYRDRYLPKSTTTATLAEWRRRWPEAEFDVKRRVLTLRGDIATHRQFRQAVEMRDERDPRPENTEAVALNDRRFTLEAQDVPVRAIMANLETTGVEFQYDAAALRAAGVDLDERVTLDLRDADAAQFFEAVFGPLGVSAEFEDATVELSVEE